MAAKTNNTLPTLLIAVAISCALAPGAQAAGTVRVSCGQTITADTTLANDLIDCPDSGIVIGADGIELDLNGHTIDGDGVLGCEELYACDFGVDNTAGHHGVTIEDGAIRDFATAVVVRDAGDNRLRRLSASRNILGGMLVIASPGARIEHTRSRPTGSPPTRRG